MKIVVKIDSASDTGWETILRLFTSHKHVTGACAQYDMGGDDKEIVNKIDEHITEAYKLAQLLRRKVEKKVK